MNAIRATLILIGKGLLLAAIVLAMMFVAIFVYVLAAVLNGRDIDQILTFQRMNLTLAVIQDLFLIAGVWIIYIAFERKSGWPFGLKQRGAAVRLAYGMAFGAILMTIVTLLIWLFGGLRFEAASASQARWLSLLWGVFVFAVVAFSEELLTRGYVQGLVKLRFGAVAAVAVSSLLFAVMHFGNASVFDSIWPTVNLVLAGVILGISREVSGGLWLPIGFHLTWNYFQGYIYGFEVSGADVESVFHLERTGRDLVSGGAFGAEGSAATTAVLLVGIAALLWAARRQRR
ncbi:CPBP family intramembrane glutamic endopeptidase [Cohnella nanjingensis]|uniref:CPBP family intramembrane metalloprotease n=1 Tax=Cohnella nanjingensis TaxID=1387779 RepID=A0A7X0RQ42_9BACL|nr:type II CAAX endopeptidase family protein [Cohnella nanjingensis]MBB6671624.1 CPBP family intramembrane metalloprotease [Cohnella nanjingensis]